MKLEEAIQKAIKLLKLAESPNVNEAALAAAKAQEIIDRYKLDVNSLDFDAQERERDAEEVKDFGYADPLDKVTYLKAWMTRLASVVCRVNQCKLVYCKKDLTGEGRARGAFFRIIGRPSDVNTVRYLYAYFKGEVTRLRDANCQGNSGTYKRQFCLGVVDTVGAMIIARQQETDRAVRVENSSNPMALVKVNNAIAKRDRKLLDIDAFLKANVPGLTQRTTGRTTTVTGDVARMHGQVIGAQVRISSARGALGASRKELE